eukprot:6464036-Amphidinium_carterae.1
MAPLQIHHLEFLAEVAVVEEAVAEMMMMMNPEMGMILTDHIDLGKGTSRKCGSTVTASSFRNWRWQNNIMLSHLQLCNN